MKQPDFKPTDIPGLDIAEWHDTVPPGMFSVTPPAPRAQRIELSLTPIEPLVERYKARERLQKAARAEARRQNEQGFAADGTSYLNLPMLLVALVCLGAVAAVAWGVVKVVLALAALPLPLAIGIPATLIAAVALMAFGVRQFSTRNEGFAA